MSSLVDIVASASAEQTGIQVETPANDVTLETQETQAAVDPTEALRAEIRKELEKEVRSKFGEIGVREAQLKKREKMLETFTKANDALSKGEKLTALQLLGIDADGLYDEITTSILNKPKAPKVTVDDLPEEERQAILFAKELQAKELQRQQQESIVRVKEFISSVAASKEAHLVKNIPGAIDFVNTLADNKISMLKQEDPDAHIDPAEIVEWAVQETEQFYRSQFDTVVESDYGKKMVESKYSKYLEAKQQEKEKPVTTLSSRLASSVKRPMEQQRPANKKQSLVDVYRQLYDK